MESDNYSADTKAKLIDRVISSCVNVLVILVVMLILYSLVIPNMIDDPSHFNPAPAIADIGGIDAALIEVLADADCSTLEQLFDPDAVSAYMTKQRKLEHWPPVNASEFAAATELYTGCLYAVLRRGRNAMGGKDLKFTDLQYGAVLREEVIGRLGLSYIYIANDPWGNLYNIYPGPWVAKTPSGEPAPIPFRIFSEMDITFDCQGVQRPALDGLEVPTMDYVTEEKLDAGFPAPTNEVAFIWSNGANLLSSQLIYNANGYATGERYDPSQGPEFVGGADDINNWDSGSSWMKLY